MSTEDWQPIETAPKDGSDIQTWHPTLFGNGRVRIGFWRPSDSRWGFLGCQGIGHERANQPTHWMPLPNPPRQP